MWSLKDWNSREYYIDWKEFSLHQFAYKDSKTKMLFLHWTTSENDSNILYSWTLYIYFILEMYPVLSFNAI